MFEVIALEDEGGRKIEFTFNGASVSAKPGMTIAAALLAAGQNWFRETAVSGRQRGPFCMMGACYDCIVSIDGVTVQACMIEVMPGLAVQSVKRPGGSRNHA